MCSTQFSEGSNRLIRLPEDDPDLIGRMLEFLYGSHQVALRFNRPGHEAAEKLLAIYFVADKYRLAKLQESIMENFTELEYMIRSPLEFFEVTNAVLSKIPRSDTTFNPCFDAMTKFHLRFMKPVQVETLATTLEGGGQFASKAFSVLSRLHHGSEQASQVMATKYQEAHTNLKTATAEHAIYHARCTRCSVCRTRSSYSSSFPDEVI